MPTCWKKAARDLWMARTRTGLVVLAIALGVAASQAVLAAYAIITRELNTGYLATNRASATLRTDVVDDELMAAIRMVPGVRDAEARRSVRGRVKVGPAEWRNLVLFVVKNFGDIRISTLRPQSGAWPPGTGELLIERDAFQVARTSLGSTVTVKLPGGPPHALRVAGSVHDVGQAQARMENLVYGYITLETLAQLGEKPYLDQLNVLVSGNQFDERHVRTVAAQLRDMVEGRGHHVVRLDVPKPGRHPHADIMGMLLLAMSTFGLAVLVLSGILIVNLMTALMAAQVRQVGVMQALGGSRGQIARIYLAQALAMGVGAVIVAFPAGLAGSHQLCTYLAVFLNFDITSFSVPVWVSVVVGAVGVLVPLVAAAYPVWKGCGLPVREALTDFGVSLGTSSQDAFGSSRLDRLMVAMAGPARPFAMAVRNGLRRRTRLALTLLTLASGGLFFMSALNIRGSMILTLDRVFEARTYDLSVTLGGMYPIEQIQRALDRTPGVLRTAEWIGTDASISHSQAAPGTSGIGAHESGGAASAHGRLPGMANGVRVALERTDAASVNAARAGLDASLEVEGITALASTSKADSRFSFDQHMVMIYMFLIVMSLILAGVGGLGLATTMSLNVLERRREIGVVRAIGATPKDVWIMMVTEGVAIGILSWMVAGLVAWPVSKALGNLLATTVFQRPLDFRFEAEGLLGWLLVVVLLGVVASALAARHALRLTIREALTYE